MPRIMTAALAMAALTAALAGCGPSSHSHPAASLLTGTAATQVKHDLTRCMPASTFAQASYLQKLVTDTKAHPNGSRRQFFGCMGIARQDEQPFLNEVLAAAETAASNGQLSTKAGRREFAEVTVPQIAVQFTSHVAAVKPSPSVTR